MINISNIENLIEKDSYEVLKSKYILFTLVFLPLVLSIVVPFSILRQVIGSINLPLSHSGGSGSNLFKSLRSFLPSANLPAGLTDLQKSFIMMSYISDFLFLLIPLMVPIIIGADSIAGEKDRGSFEALLATPLTNSEILIGKIGLPVILGIAGTIIGLIPYLMIVYYMTSPYISLFYIFNINFILMVAVLTPTASLLSSIVMVFISSRTTSTREAQQLGTFVVLPVLVFFFFQIILILYSPLTIIIGAALLIFIDAILLKFSINTFSRENIMTKYT